MNTDSTPHMPAISPYRRSKIIDLIVKITILLLIAGLLADMIAIGMGVQVR